jgi:hypothetical protein
MSACRRLTIRMSLLLQNQNRTRTACPSALIGSHRSDSGLAGRSILLLAGRPICDRFWLAAGWILLRSRAALLLMLAWGASGSNAAAAVIMNTCTHSNMYIYTPPAPRRAPPPATPPATCHPSSVSDSSSSSSSAAHMPEPWRPLGTAAAAAAAAPAGPCKLGLKLHPGCQNPIVGLG